MGYDKGHSVQSQNNAAESILIFLKFSIPGIPDTVY